MIRYKVKIYYRDDTDKTYDCFDYPAIGDKYLTLYMDKDYRRYIAQEKISEFEVKDYWKK